MFKKICLALLLSLPLYAENSNDDLSQTLGHFIVRQLSQPGFEFNFEKVIQGMQDARNGKEAPMSEAAYEEALCAIQEKLFEETSIKNLAEAESFLKANAQKKEIKKINDKLHYQVVQKGKGAAVNEDSVPLIHYQGKLIDGTVFASSEEAGKPVVLPIQQAVTGFVSGIIGMKEGEKRILYVHPDLTAGINGQLPPGSLLIFEIEIVQAHSNVLEEVAQQ